MDDIIRALCVEDDSDIRDVIKFSLEDEDFELLLCSSGNDAVQMAGQFKPDVIILDVMMPDMDGPNTLRELRTFPELENTPVIFMTAKARPSEIAQYKAMGALDVITKPFDPVCLSDDIRTILTKKRA